MRDGTFCRASFSTIEINLLFFGFDSSWPSPLDEAATICFAAPDRVTRPGKAAAVAGSEILICLACDPHTQTRNDKMIQANKLVDESNHLLPRTPCGCFDDVLDPLGITFWFRRFVDMSWLSLQPRAQHARSRG